jgi:hypothetical protein
MIYRALFNAVPPRLVDRRDDRGNFAFLAVCRGDVDCLRFSALPAKAAITDSPIAMKRAQGPSAPTLWQLTRSGQAEAALAKDQAANLVVC